MILLDTHVLLWWVSGEDKRLSSRARRAMSLAQKQDEKMYVSSISAWEIAMLVARQRLTLSMDVSAWLTTVAETRLVEFMPMDNEIAIKAVDLPGLFHKDPADRMIVATARKMAATLITADEKIQAYEHVKWLW